LNAINLEPTSILQVKVSPCRGNFEENNYNYSDDLNSVNNGHDFCLIFRKIQVLISEPTAAMLHTGILGKLWAVDYVHYNLERNATRSLSKLLDSYLARKAESERI
jgi:hypothetical protein